MDYKQETIKCYDIHALMLNKAYHDHFYNYEQGFADKFLSHLGGVRSVLDLGSGPGFAGRHFDNHGANVLCADLSEKMVELCHNKGLRAIQMDIEDICLPENYFDGIWAYASLLHVPKAKMPDVASRIERILMPDGILAVALKEGKSEGFETRKSLGSGKRWFSHYTEDEAREMFGNFGVIDSSKTQVEKMTFLHLLMRSNKPRE